MNFSREVRLSCHEGIAHFCRHDLIGQEYESKSLRVPLSQSDQHSDLSVNAESCVSISIVDIAHSAGHWIETEGIGIKSG